MLCLSWKNWSGLSTDDELNISEDSTDMLDELPSDSDDDFELDAESTSTYLMISDDDEMTLMMPSSHFGKYETLDELW